MTASGVTQHWKHLGSGRSPQVTQLRQVKPDSNDRLPLATTQIPQQRLLEW